MPIRPPSPRRLLTLAGTVLTVAVLPVLLGTLGLGAWRYGLAIPFVFQDSDGTWQFVLSKMLYDTGWVLNDPYLAAPGVAHWYGNASAQTSATHSVLMLLLRPFAPDAVTMQQAYHLLGYALISTTAYVTARLFGAARAAAACAGIVFALSSFRVNGMVWLFLANYFIVPLACIAPLWVLTGRFVPPHGASPLRALRATLLSPRFGAALLLTLLTAVTDGYFAFFTLLLLAAAAALRALAPWRERRILALAAPALLCAALAAAALALAAPLRAYEHKHPDEFTILGQPDPTLVKHPFEAEVYASSLKLLLAPIPQSRIPALAQLGHLLIDTTEEARKFPVNAYPTLGTLGALLLLATFAAIFVRVVHGARAPQNAPPDSLQAHRNAPALNATVGLALFTFLTATTGGVGSLIALVYPTIRAYDRIALFLHFLLLLAAALAVTPALARAARWRPLANAALLALALLAAWDQLPGGSGARDPKAMAGFLDDRSFVRTMEAALPPGAAVYQYPYSQYISENPYYGWGVFSYLRFYLHSHALRWSTGAFKNSPEDRFHAAIAALPQDRLLTEVAAVGFDALLVDRTVVPDPEYATLRALLVARTGLPPTEDPTGRLAWFRLADPGYRLHFGPGMSGPESVTVTSPHARDPATLSRLVDPARFAALLGATPLPATFGRAANPLLFRDTGVADLGLGALPIPPGALQGDVACPRATDRPLSARADTLVLHLANRSAFDWKLNAGTLPIRIGLRAVYAADGATLRVDKGGYRVPGPLFVPSGTSIDIPVRLATIDIRPPATRPDQPVTAAFTLLQEGVAWYGPTQGDTECRVPVLE